MVLKWIFPFEGEGVFVLSPEVQEATSGKADKQPCLQSQVCQTQTPNL